MTLMGVLNPNRKGGSGNFKVSSLLGKMVLDENLAFASIGIGEKVSYFHYARVYMTNPAVGVTTNYFFEFKSAIYMPK